MTFKNAKYFKAPSSLAKKDIIQHWNFAGLILHNGSLCLFSLLLISCTPVCTIIADLFTKQQSFMDGDI